jgi:hypothetical protein
VEEEVGRIRLVGECVFAGVGDSMKRVRSGLGEGKMEGEHIAVEL